MGLTAPTFSGPATPGGVGSSSSSSAAPLLPLLALGASDIDYEYVPGVPGLIARAPMRYPQDGLANVETTTQGFTVSNPTAGAMVMTATGGLTVGGVERGYLEMTPDVSGGYIWNSVTRTAERPYRDYPAIDGGVAGAEDQQVWYAAIKTDSTMVNNRGLFFLLSNAAAEGEVARFGMLYTGSALTVYTDSAVLGATSAALGSASTTLWLAFVRAAASRTVLCYYYTGGGTAPPALSSMTLLGTHTNLLGTAAATARLGFTTTVATDTSTAFVGKVLAFDDRLALPRLDARTLRQIAIGVVTYPVPGFGFRLDQPELVIADGPCSEDLTQAKIRAVLAACENPRTGYDTASWSWKVERYASGGSPSGGSFAAAGSVTVAGSGAYVRVTVRPEATATTPGSLDTTILRAWSTA